MSKRKGLLLAFVTIIVGLFITAGSYAFWSWTSGTNKSVSFNIAKALRNYIVYDEGDSQFSGEFKVGNTYTSGIHSTISISKTAEAANIDLMAIIHMDINQIGENMKNSPALKWQVTLGNSSNPGTTLAKGNFVGTKNGDTLDLVNNIEVTTTPTEYTIWIWLDANENPSDALTGETLDTNVWTEINQLEGVEDRYEITRIGANYQNISATVVDSKYKVTHYAVVPTGQTPSNWTSIGTAANIYNLNTTVNAPGIYDVYFKDENNRMTHKSVTVDAVDTTAPSCSFGSFTPVQVANNETATIELTCTDNESELTVSNLKTSDITRSNTNITITNITKTAVSHGYKYTITVRGTENDGETTLTLPSNKVKNSVGLGNGQAVSSAITIANEYTVKFATGNNNCTLDTTTTYADKEPTYGQVFNIPNPSCTGYTFAGWTANSGLDTTNAKYGNASNSVTTTWSSASNPVTATYFKDLAKRDNKTVTLTANWGDTTKPVCTVATPTSVVYGSTTTIDVTCTDNESMTSQPLTTSAFTSSNTSVATIQSVSNPTAVTGGYKYTVTVKGVGVGTYTLSINANAITDTAGNKNNQATSANGTVTAKSVTPTATASDKTYDGGTNATCTITLSGVISGDTVTASAGTHTFDNKNVGTNKTVTCSNITLGGANAGNYTLSTTSLSPKAKITAKAITINIIVRSHINSAYFNNDIIRVELISIIINFRIAC